MSQSQRHPNASEVEKGDPDTYFDDTSAEWRQLEEKRDELALRQEALRRLDERVAKIDCDIGGASIKINDEGVIHVKTSTPDICDEIEQLLHGYSWPKEFQIGYETRSKCVTWSLKTDIGTLVDDYHQQITE
jgi:hypothetical protein